MRNAGIFPPNTVTHRSSSKRTILVRKHVVWAIGLKRKNRSSGSTWAQDREKSKDRTGQDSKKSHKVVTFRLFREMPPTASIETQICMVGHLADLITYAKFQDDFQGLRFYRGLNFPFSYWFLHGPVTVGATVLPVIDRLIYVQGWEYISVNLIHPNYFLVRASHFLWTLFFLYIYACISARKLNLRSVTKW